MRRAGYTLVEVMGATLILGLAFMALFQGMGVVRGLQARSAARMVEGRAADSSRAVLARVLGQPGLPGIALADRLTGDQTGFKVRCGAPPCALMIQIEDGDAWLVSQLGDARLRRPLTGITRPALRYVTSDGDTAHWPAGPQSPAKLLAIAIVDEAADASPVATVRLWSDQPHDCMFDSITAKCRPPLP